MKYYETTFEEYLSSVNKYNIHPEIKNTIDSFFPKQLCDFGNIIVYGPSGSGKYSQVLSFLKKYSPSELKYEKNMKVETDKQNYVYPISDIHYEIDMSFLGCNSKILWHELFFQIVYIVAVKQEKIGIIVCKNFHMINSELLEIFYSYMQQYNNIYMNLIIRFVIITEHISFIPTNIINNCEILSIKKPIQSEYIELIHNMNMKNGNKIKNIINEIDTSMILNLKENRCFALVKSIDQFPTDIFNIICNKIIEDIKNININFVQFRDSLYDILIYNLDITECLWYVLNYFIIEKQIKSKDISDVLKKTFSFLKYYNNNYRPIYHLESIFFYLIIKIHGYETESNKNDKGKSNESSGNKKGRKQNQSSKSKKAVSHDGVEISS